MPDSIETRPSDSIETRNASDLVLASDPAWVALTGAIGLGLTVFRLWVLYRVIRATGQIDRIDRKLSNKKREQS